MWKRGYLSKPNGTDLSKPKQIREEKLYGTLEENVALLLDLPCVERAFLIKNLFNIPGSCLP
jgi:hypothetical protein